MKKILYITSLALTFATMLFLGSCNKDTKTKDGKETGILYTSVSGSEATIKLMEGKSRTLDAVVCAEAAAGASLKISLKVDPAGVDAYNAANLGANAELLPATAYSFISNSLLLARYNTVSSGAKLRIVANGLEDDQLYVLPIAIDKVEGSDNWELAQNPVSFITVIQTVERPEGGDGSMQFPFELSTAEDLTKMGEKLSEDEKVYFKLMNDIDMQGVVWTPLNYASPYKKAIDFDGAGHKISNFFCDFSSYPSFFGVLNGYCHDVTFVDAEIACGADSGCGIIAGYGGTGDIHADAARVHVQGKVTLTGNKTGVGGMFGTLGNATIVACSADVQVESGKNFVGGLFGYAKGNADKCVVEVSNCWTSGSVKGNQRVGGICGGTDKTGYNVKIINCYSTATVEGVFCLGGIGGHFNLDSSSNPDTNQPNDVFENCIAWNPSIKCAEQTAGDKAHYSSGAVVGFTAKMNYLKGGVRRPDIDFYEYSDLFSLYDQEDATPSSPLVFQKVEGAVYNYPYHGKVAESGKTLTQVAQALGWNAAIWDFSKDVPTIRPDAPVGPVPDTTTGGQLHGFDDNEIN